MFCSVGKKKRNSGQKLQSKEQNVLLQTSQQDGTLRDRHKNVTGEYYDSSLGCFTCCALQKPRWAFHGHEQFWHKVKNDKLKQDPAAYFNEKVEK